MTPTEYLELAACYERAARERPSLAARRQLHAIADTYLTLAKSTALLEQSEKVIESLVRRDHVFRRSHRG